MIHASGSKHWWKHMSNARLYWDRTSLGTPLYYCWELSERSMMILEPGTKLLRILQIRRLVHQRL